MKILFRQPERNGALATAGLTKCYLKLLQPVRDGQTKKEHHHMGYEVHIVLEGAQCYRVAGAEYDLPSGSFLLIPPGVAHQVLSSQPQTRKIGITFQLERMGIRSCWVGRISPRLGDNLRFMEAEAGAKKAFSPMLIENCLLETIVTVLRCAGMEESGQPKQQEENAVLGLAKQYIEDNIDRAPEVDTVAQYCYVSTKQLTRLFQRIEGISPGAYIARIRIARMEVLLQEGELTLKQISEMLHFSSEYYFNAFFKKHAGMPPGAYRKMHEK